jgi:2-dehydropantoate 2-reductase
MENLSVLSIGAGAIGTYIAGSLAYSGHNLVILEQPEVITELNNNGLHLDLKDRVIHLHQFQTSDLLEKALSLGNFDFAIMAIKSFDTDAFLKKLIPFKDTCPPILCLQNGVENEAKLSTILGTDKVIPGTVTSSIGRIAAGAIVLERKRGMGLSKHHPLSDRLIKEFNFAGLNAHQFSDPVAMKWSKMLTNLLANASAAILDMTPAEIFSNPELSNLEITQLREALRVMAALGIHPLDLPKTPVRSLAFAVQKLPPSLTRHLLKMSVGKGRGGKMPSFYIDLHNQRGHSEVDYLNGAVVRFGNSSGIPTPVNKVLNDTLLGLTYGNLPISRFAHQPKVLLDLLAK